jgi:hypothetical protein
MKVTINGQELGVTEMTVTISRDGIDTIEPYVPLPAFSGSITGVVDTKIVRAIFPRKMCISGLRAGVIAVLMPRIKYEGLGTKWNVYRRDFKRGRVHLKEVI